MQQQVQSKHSTTTNEIDIVAQDPTRNQEQDQRETQFLKSQLREQVEMVSDLSSRNRKQLRENERLKSNQQSTEVLLEQNRHLQSQINVQQNYLDRIDELERANAELEISMHVPKTVQAPLSISNDVDESVKKELESLIKSLEDQVCPFSSFLLTHRCDIKMKVSRHIRVNLK